MAPIVKQLSEKYLRMYPLKDLDWKTLVDNLMYLHYEEQMNFQRQLLYNTLYHPVAVKFSPTASYSRLFLRNFIAQIEDLKLEVCEELYSAYSELLSSDSPVASEDKHHCYKTYCLDPDLQITLKETKAIVSNGTTGMFTWEASHVLVNWCYKQSARFFGKDILELGAGLGLTGIAVIKSCSPASYTFTDIHTSVLKILKENVLINLQKENFIADNFSVEKSNFFSNDEEDSFKTSYKGVKVMVKKLDWAVCNISSEIILAADVVYDIDIIPFLIDALHQAFSNKKGTTAYIASTIRNPETFKFFRNKLKMKNIRVLSESHHMYQGSPSQPHHEVIIMHLSL